MAPRPASSQPTRVPSDLGEVLQALPTLAADAEDPAPVSKRAVCQSTSEVRAVCGSSARTDLCGGWPARAIPTAIVICWQDGQTKDSRRLLASPLTVFPATGASIAVTWAAGKVSHARSPARAWARESVPFCSEVFRVTSLASMQGGKDGTGTKRHRAPTARHLHEIGHLDRFTFSWPTRPPAACQAAARGPSADSRLARGHVA